MVVLDAKDRLPYVDLPVIRRFTRTVEREIYDTTVINLLWRFSNEHGVVMDIFATDGSQRSLDKTMAELDRLQAHPFRSAILYPNPRALVSELASRYDVVGVIDLPERGLRYGSRWIDPTNYF